MDTPQSFSFTNVALIGVGLFIFMVVFLLVLVWQQIYLRRKTKAFYEKELNANEQAFTQIAAEVHDDLGSTLYGIKLKFKNIIDGKHYTAERLQEVMELLHGLQQRIKRSSLGLLPKELSEQGLRYAIDNFLIPLERDAAMSIDTLISLEHEPDKTISLHVYRIIQELMHNSLRHSGATRVEIRLSEKEKTLRLLFRDNGKGLAADAVEMIAASGMSTVKNRVVFLDGSFRTGSPAGEGMVIEIMIPLP